jgi:hypothetical protein
MDPKDRIPAEWPNLDAPLILRKLVAGGVDFVVIGGIAVILHGYPRLTRDLDIAFAYDDANLDALGRVLTDLDATLRGVDAEVPFVPDKRTLSGIELLTLETSAGWIDIHRLPRGVATYASLRRNAERVPLEDFYILVASPDDLIGLPVGGGRPLDRADSAARAANTRLRSG